MTKIQRRKGQTMTLHRNLKIEQQTDITMTKIQRRKGQTMTLHRNLKIEQHELH